jgi:hypothetical protein
LLPRRTRLCSRASSTTRLSLKTRNVRITKLKPVTTSRNVLNGVCHAFNCGNHAERKSHRPDGRGRGLCLPPSRPCRASRSPAQLSITNCDDRTHASPSRKGLCLLYGYWGGTYGCTALRPFADLILGLGGLVCWQPAHMCNVLDHGDEIISVDGQPTPTKEAVLPLLRGSDVPGSNVDITVKKV